MSAPGSMRAEAPETEWFAFRSSGLFYQPHAGEARSFVLAGGT